MVEVPSVLIMDTEPAVAKCCEQWLRDGYTVHQQNTDEKFDVTEIDVILLGRAVRAISKEEVFEAIRNRTADCRVVLITDSDSEFDVLDTAFDEHLMKPLDEAQLRATIEKLVKRATLNDALHRYYLVVARHATVQQKAADGTTDAQAELARLTERADACRRSAEQVMGDLTSDSEFVGAIREVMDYDCPSSSRGE